MLDLSIAIRDYVYRYINGDISLNDFQAWFIPATWNIHQHRDTSTQRMVSEILGRLAEYLNGDWSQDEFNDILRSIAQNIIISSEEQTMTSSDSNNIILKTTNQQVFPEEMRHKVALSYITLDQDKFRTNKSLRFSFA